LVPYYKLQELRGRMVVCVCNIKPATLGGMYSNAMMLGASSNGKVELLDPPKVNKREGIQKREEIWEWGAREERKETTTLRWHFEREK